MSKDTLTYFIQDLSIQNINYVNLNVSDIFELIVLGTFVYFILITIPIILLFVYRNYESGLYEREKKTFKIFISLYPLSFLGIMIGYFVGTEYIIPFFIDYNNSFGMENYSMLINLIKLVWTTMLTFAVIIQIPTLLILLKKNGIIKKQKMKDYRIFFLIFALLMGAFLSPPDGISMLIFGIPIYLGYELSIWL